MIENKRAGRIVRIASTALAGALVVGASFVTVSAASAHTLSAGDNYSSNGGNGVHSGTHLSVVTAPHISGVGAIGQTLTLTPGTWTTTPDSVSEQWYSDHTPITGATGTTYSVTAADAGHHITVRESATIAGHKAHIARSNRIHVARANHLVRTQELSVTGTPAVGQILTVTPAIYTPVSDSVAFQWQRNGADIHGATTSSYQVTADDAGTNLRVVETDTKSGFNTATERSNRLWVPAS